MSIKITPAKDNRIIVDTPYNAAFVERAKMAGGVWNSANRAWIFPAEQTAAVRSILMDVYGEDDRAADVARVRLRCVCWVQELPYGEQAWPNEGGALDISLAGRQVARAFGRDSGARPGADVVVVAGGFSSGGSRNNPRLTVKDGTVVDLLRTPETIARRLIASHPHHFRVVADDGAELSPAVDADNVVPFKA